MKEKVQESKATGTLKMVISKRKKSKNEMKRKVTKSKEIARNRMRDLQSKDKTLASQKVVVILQK